MASNNNGASQSAVPTKPSECQCHVIQRSPYLPKSVSKNELRNGYVQIIVKSLNLPEGTEETITFPKDVDCQRFSVEVSGRTVFHEHLPGQLNEAKTHVEKREFSDSGNGKLDIRLKKANKKENWSELWKGMRK